MRQFALNVNAYFLRRIGKILSICRLRYIEIFVLIFPSKHALTFHANCLSYFSQKN